MTSRDLSSATCCAITTVLLLLATLDARPASAQNGQPSPVDQTPSGQSAAARREKEREQRRRQDDGEDPDGTDRRPYRAVFGGASKRTDLTHTFDFTGSVTENYDDDRLAEVAAPDASRLANSDGFYTGLVGDLAFRRKGGRLELVLNGGANARYYSDLKKALAPDYHVGAGVSARMSPRTNLRFDQAFSYAPVDLLGVFVGALPPTLGQVAPVSTDFAVNDNRSYSNSTSGQLSRRLSPRGDFTMSGSVLLRHFLTGNTTFRETGGGAVYAYRMNAGASLRLGYGYRQAQYQGTPGDLPNPAEHALDIGVDLHRTLSDSRRTSFTLKTGSAMLQAPSLSNPLQTNRQLRLLVDASLAREIGETWHLVGSYRRGSDLVVGLASPIFSDAWTVSTNGFFSRRADFTSALSYSTGEPSLATVTSQTFTTYTGNARLRVAIHQRWATTAEYLHYFYDFTKTPLLAPGFDPRFSRNLFRVGLSLWLPFGHQ